MYEAMNALTVTNLSDPKRIVIKQWDDDLDQEASIVVHPEQVELLVQWLRRAQAELKDAKA